MSEIKMSCTLPRVHKGALRLDIFTLETSGDVFFALKPEHDRGQSALTVVWSESQPGGVNYDRKWVANASLLIERLVGVGWSD